MTTLLPRGIVGVVALLVTLSCLQFAQSSPVPGDQYPTVGLTLGGYTYSVNVTTYANVSADVRDIIRATPNFGSDFGPFAAASSIYTEGKNSYRNQILTPPTFRLAKAVIDRNYTSNGPPVQVEAWYELAATQFYTDLNKFYLDKYISDPLAGRNEFNKSAGGELASVRKPIIDASILFYPVLYFYHEVDAGWNALKRAALGINTASNVQSASDESQDAVGCILAPNVINSNPAQRVATGANPTERVAPGYNPWDVSNRVGTHFCTCAPTNKPGKEETSVQGHRHNKGQETSHKGEEVSIANTRFLHLAKNLQGIFEDGATPTPEQYGNIRTQMQRVLNGVQIQLTLESVDQASDSEVLSSCIADFQRGVTLDDNCGVISKGAAAWAHWRMAMPALWSEVPTTDYKTKLMAIADLLHPTAWAQLTSKGQLRHHLEDIMDGVQEVVKEAGYRWRDIVNCKSDSHKERHHYE